ncbi:hypothetical protein HK102_000297 [Quaeritorhiza haematococci]|nr:hypothetical protein HK102_000297 [Quaeritorhiza haematococci]
MASSFIQYLLNRQDPVQFFSGSSSSSSSSTLAPYKVSTASTSPTTAATSSVTAASKSTTNAVSDFLHTYNFDLDPFDNQDLASFALQNYVLSVVTGPLEVVNTLSEVQYQRRESYDSEVCSLIELAVVLSLHEFLAEPLLVMQTKDAEQDVNSGLSNFETVQHSGPHGALYLTSLNDGVWENIRHVVENENEGWTALLKGHFTSFMYNASFSYLQPNLEEVFNDILDVYEDTHPATMILSHIVVGGLLSPLELVRTRLIVQSSASHRKKYYGPFHALHAITQEESVGTIGSLYSARHLIPSLFVHALGPLVRVVSQYIITEELGLTSTFNPVLYKLATIAFMAAEVAVVTPFDVARKRLQLQKLTFPRRTVEAAYPGATTTASTTPTSPTTTTGSIATSGAQMFDTVVEVSSTLYRGVWDCIRCILTEEGVKKRKRRRLPGVGKEWEPIYGDQAVPSSPHLGSDVGTGSLSGLGIGKRAGSAFGGRTDSSVTYNSWSEPSPWGQSPRQRSRSEAASPGSVREQQQSIQYWVGLKSLYRGFWARYAIRVVKFVFEEMGQPEDW